MSRLVSRASSWLRRRQRQLIVFIGLSAVLLLILQWEKLSPYVPRHASRLVMNGEWSGEERVEAECPQPVSLTQHIAPFHTGEIFASIAGRRSAGAGGLGGAAVGPSKKQKLRVFILPFTHVDPGWLKTFDEYTKDTNKILDNMHNFMTKNEKMRFMWAEFVFFERWWSMQDNKTKEDVQELVRSGRLEFASGSWVMTDEANAYFPVSVDNIVEGHQYLAEHFNMTPSVVWSNDPFGYSNSVPYLFAEAGLRRGVINRIHHGIKQHLQARHAIPFRWTQYFDQKSEVLTHVLPYSHYDILNSCGPQPGDCCQFDFKRITHWSCPGPKPTNIDKDNVNAKSKILVAQLQRMAEMYDAPVLLMVHGDDFRFDMIEEWHQHHDNFLPLFEHINKGDEVEISFGTFSDYFNALEGWYKKEQKQPSALTGDFFPYMCALGDYWTGYFTTRPFFKKQGRQVHNLIRAADLLSSSALGTVGSSGLLDKRDIYGRLTKARRTLALFQHHDAITGTSKNSVMENYSRLLHEASRLAGKAIEHSVAALNGGKQQFTMLEFAAEFDQTLSLAPLTVDAKQSIRLSVYNSLPSLRYTVISVLCRSPLVVVKEETGDGYTQEVAAQLEPALVKGVLDPSLYMISFRARLAPLSSTRFVFSHVSQPSPSLAISKLTTTASFLAGMQKRVPKELTVSSVGSGELHLKNAAIETVHDPDSGLLQVVRGVKFCDQPLSLDFAAFSGSSGGAYIMRASHNPTKVGSATNDRLFVSGPVREVAHVWVEEILVQSLSIHNLPGDLASQLHLQLRVDISKKSNYELVMQIKSRERANSSGNTTEPSFFTDSVGLQMIRRDFFESIGTAANYYPMPSSAFVQDGDKRITVLTNVEHGIRRTSAPLSMEIMLDRKLNQDDGKGLGGGADGIPNDMKPVEIGFTILTEQRSGEASLDSHFAQLSPSASLALQRLLYPPVTLFASAEEQPSLSDPLPSPSLPCSLQLLTVRQLPSGRHLLILFRHAVDCAFESKEAACSHLEFGSSLAALLSHFGLSSSERVQPSLLNGVSPSGPELLATPESLGPLLPEPMKFLALTFRL